MIAGAGRALKDNGFVFDAAYTSVLKRAIRTLWLALDEMDLCGFRCTRVGDSMSGITVHRKAQKAETAAKFGEEQVLVWRRSYDIPPPALEESDPRYPGRDPRYASLSKEELPLTECLKDTVARFLPHWNRVIAPAVASGQRALITAHGNSIRALVKYLDNVSDEEIVGLNVPTGVPLVYELDDHLKPLRHYYLGDQEEIAKAMQSVANQGKAAK